jgi:hypothetical protein
MNVVVSSIFRVLCFPHEGKFFTINQLVFCIQDLGSNARSNTPFVGDTQQSYMHVGVGMFKDPSLIGIFPLPPPSLIANIDPINKISSFTDGSLGSFDPWVVHCPNNLIHMEHPCRLPRSRLPTR